MRVLIQGGSMIRFILFAILGPFLGFLVFIVLGGGFKSHTAESFTILLSFAFVAGFLPALATAALDRVIEMRGARSLQRYLLTGLIGYAAAYLLMLENLFEPSPLLPFRFDWGLIGAIPAVICSWATDKAENAGRRETGKA
jgi:hypothetical protein